MDILLALNRIVLAIVFAVAAVGKILDREGARKSVVDFGAPKFLAVPIATLLPLAELACAAALLPASWAVWGAAGILSMLIAFSALMGINMAMGRRPPCHCFGQMSSEPIGPGTLARNALLAGMAALVIWQAPKNPPLGEVWLSLGDNRAVVPTLTLAVVALALFQFWMLIALLKQNGRLILRLEKVEARLRLDRGDEEGQGLPVGSPAPSYRLVQLEGNAVALDELFQSSPKVLLVFLEPGCGPCEAILPELAAWQARYAERLRIVPISRGKREENQALSAQHDLRDVLLQQDREAAEAYRVPGTPAAVLVKEGKIASRLASGHDEIEGLVVRHSLPPPAKPGEPLPSLVLNSLSGDSVDVSGLRGRRRLVVLWDTECGYCKEVTEELKAWERKLPESFPELLIVSGGSPEAVRALGFRSEVLLDPHFALGTVAGARGTPSAFLLDEEGKIASEVGAGIAGVFDFLGAAPYVPSSEEAVDAMLRLAGVTRNDTVFDLGCGDGRIVIAAAKKYGARGVGIDINPDRIQEARSNARQASVHKYARFEEKDIFEADLSEATVVTLYLLPQLLNKLSPKLQSELRPGARVVSNHFAIDGWAPEAEEQVDGAKIYLWTVPPRSS